MSWNRCLCDSITCKLNCFLISNGSFLLSFVGYNGRALLAPCRVEMRNKIFIATVKRPQKDQRKIINFNVTQFIIIEFHCDGSFYSCSPSGISLRVARKVSLSLAGARQLPVGVFSIARFTMQISFL